MTTISHTMFGHSTLLERLYSKPVDNRTIITEEERGYGFALRNNHLTEIADNDVRQRVVQMSVLEIIS